MLLGGEPRIAGVSTCYSHQMSCISDIASGRMGLCPGKFGGRYVVETASFC
jgi:hypothetical protein